MGHHVAAAGIQLRDRARRAQRPPALGLETPRRPGLEVRVNGRTLTMTNADALNLPAESAEWKLPSRRKVAIACLILSETAMFTIFVVAYMYYIGKSLTGPYPADVLETPIVSTI